MKLGEVIGPIVELLRDAQEAEHLLERTDTQFYRRAYIRSTMAAIEGIVWIIKQTCIKARPPGARTRLSIGEFALLSDRSYELKDNGDVKPQTKFLKLPDNLRFAITTFNRLFGGRIELDVGTASWESFRAAIDVRNRITHPKDAADLLISDDDIRTCKATVAWFNPKIAELTDTLAERGEPHRDAHEGKSDEPVGDAL